MVGDMSKDQSMNADLHVLFGAGQVGRLLAQRLLDARPYLAGSPEPTLLSGLQFSLEK